MDIQKADFPDIEHLTAEYWKSYIGVLLGGSFWIGIFGSLSAAIVLWFLPRYSFYLGLGMVGLVVHMAAFTLRDMWTGDLQPEKPEDVSLIEVSAYLAVFAIYVNVILFGAAITAIELLTRGMEQLALMVALYLPIADFYLFRKTGWSPGGLSIRAIYQIEKILGLVNNSEIENLPLVGRRNRPKFP